MDENDAVNDAGHDAAIQMALIKISRIACGKPHDDNYVDAAAYMGIAGECITHKQNEEAAIKTALYGDAVIVTDSPGTPERMVMYDEALWEFKQREPGSQGYYVCVRASKLWAEDATIDYDVIAAAFKWGRARPYASAQPEKLD